MADSGLVNFNINIADYTIDELFKLLSIDITTNSSYDDIKIQVEKSTEKYIKQFQMLQKPDIVNFFTQVKQSLIGEKEINTLSTTAQNVIMHENLFNPNKSNIVSHGGDMYNQNNGAGNPIHRKTVSKLLNVDSRFRPNYLLTTTTNYLMDLAYPINNVIEMKLCDLELPSTFYPISASYQNNYFWIRTLDLADIERLYYIVIPDGNYYFETLIKTINGIFGTLKLNLTIFLDLNYNNIGGIGEGTGLTKIGIITENDISLNKVTTGIKTFDLNFNGSQIPNERSIGPYSPDYLVRLLSKNYYTPNTLDYKQLFGWIMGYREPLYTNVIKDAAGYSYYSSESILDLSGPKYLFLVVDDFNKSMNVNFLTVSIKGLLADNIIARISQKGQIFSIQSQNDFGIYSEPRYYYGPVNINKLQIKLIDEYGRIIDLNNKDFSFTLRLTTIYSVT
jgi:hypothetical protein